MSWPVFRCSVCHVEISEDVYEFSREKMNQSLCVEHQKGKRWRTDPTPEALKLSEALKRRGWKCELEKYDGHKTIDIVVPLANVHIEVDGFTHTVNKRTAFGDLQRQYFDLKKGILTIHIPNCLVEDKEVLTKTADLLSLLLKDREIEILRTRLMIKNVSEE
jgi:very-short-patch-repair endonuclease